MLKGGGDEVGEWAVDNGFLLTPDAPEVLDYYAERSPVFMAARFDAQRAQELGQGAGDSTPIMATIPTDDPWVPVRILGLGLDGSRNVEADVFLLTDDEPELLAGGAGLTLDRSEPASDLLLSDLRSDVGMEWVPDDMWLSYMKLAAPAAELDYDLAVSATPGVTPSLVDAGVPEPEAIPVGSPDSGSGVVAAGGGRGGRRRGAGRRLDLVAAGRERVPARAGHDRRRHLGRRVAERRCAGAVPRGRPGHHGPAARRAADAAVALAGGQRGRRHRRRRRRVRDRRRRDRRSGRPDARSR